MKKPLFHKVGKVASFKLIRRHPFPNASLRPLPFFP